MTQFIEKATIITLKAKIPADRQAEFALWQSKMNKEIAGYQGFISLEFLSPVNSQQEWLIVQRFGRSKDSTDWMSSAVYQEIKQDLKNCAVANTIKEDISDESALGNGVTEVIVAEVLPEKEKDYREWIARIHLAEAGFSGFRGVYVQSPNETKGKFWITLLQFDTMEHLDTWLNSSERLRLLSESKSLISYLETHRVISPYAGWFASIAKVGELPALWKQTMIILLVLFPIVMLEFKFLNPLLKSLNISFSTFIGNAVSVTLIAILTPIPIYFLKWWLLPNAKHRKIAAVGGTLVVAALYLLSIWFFWSYV